MSVLKSKKYLPIDFEFNGTKEKELNMVSSHFQVGNEVRTIWLHNSETGKRGFKKFIEDFNPEYILSYSAVAEARSFLSLGIDPLKYKWIDLFLEYRCLSNHHDDLNYGKQFVDGKIIYVKKPLKPWEEEEGDESIEEGGQSFKVSKFKQTHSLVEATYKLLGVVRNFEEKEKTRDLILSNKDFSKEEISQIIHYGESDVPDLMPMFEVMVGEYKERLGELFNEEELIEEMTTRGQYAVYTALMETRGYPIDVESTRNFSDSIEEIMYECQGEINSLFPSISPFRWNKKENKFSWNKIATANWVLNNVASISSWPRTPTGQLQLSLEAFTSVFDFKHSYPKDNFGAQIVRYLKLKQSLAGFKEKEGKKSFWDHVGKDGMVRAYLNPYGAQSSRTQPGSTGFLFLKPAWIRAACVPPKGYFGGGLDYGSQEFFIQALLAECTPMVEAYLSGDPYLWLGKQAGVIPLNGTKKTHSAEREGFKSTTLGISYGMTEKGLAVKLTNDTGRIWTESEAKDMIETFYDIYSGLREFQNSIIKNYRRDGFIKLKCGWYMWGHNQNPRSIKNVPIQGAGASIMRKAVVLAEQRGIAITKTLHDAIYFFDKLGNEERIFDLQNAMKEAFVWYFDNPEMKVLAENIRLDPKIWSPTYEGLELFDGRIPCQNLYIDGRSKDEYDKFSIYFKNRGINLV